MNCRIKHQRATPFGVFLYNFLVGNKWKEKEGVRCPFENLYAVLT